MRVHGSDIASRANIVVRDSGIQSAFRKAGIDKGSVSRNQMHITASHAAFALLIAYCVIGAATVVVDSAGLLRNPWENTYFESPQTYAAIYAAQTGKLYIPMSQPPYTPQA